MRSLSKARSGWFPEKAREESWSEKKEKTSSIRGGTRFWGPIELAEVTLDATGRMAISFFAILQKKDGQILCFFAIAFFGLLEASPGLNVRCPRCFIPEAII
jgi:hypothetical protein